ncbi:hypothetical protein [Stigmatella aurantiaca]|uniref:Conserved uncharacterized protein n=1 Tax=Stigmatella aurantiaca (strain DW4/3-1) TaxID=378806 RepID=Q08PH7_STIAD|nr:hypothetical protein [Stigmatella aurantiaca]ADO72005.1 conserved uncharacterized protein [Stigmatella aurantiaca DW4/3-1]EAU62385.1 hypothetical protein STIAU_6423 [Stigmatella aurantiaca DW4/3-1]
MRTPSLTSLNRPLKGLASTLLLVLAPVACRREAAAPSAEYEQAHQRFSKLYGQQLDQAFLDPQMADIEAQLERVPPDSLDAQSARELLQRIRQGRERMETSQQETQDAVASAREFQDIPSSPRTEEPPPPPPAVPEPVDAGPPDAGATTGPVEGSSASELASGYQGCFRRGDQINVTGRGMRESWELADRFSCRQAYPRFANQVVLIEDGRVLSVLAKSLTRLVPVASDGGSGPDAGP